MLADIGDVIFEKEILEEELEELKCQNAQLHIRYEGYRATQRNQIQELNDEKDKLTKRNKSLNIKIRGE